MYCSMRKVHLCHFRLSHCQTTMTSFYIRKMILMDDFLVQGFLKGTFAFSVVTQAMFFSWVKPR